jgi:predicted TIM-barrel fold metal-dependent hydrolase
MAKPKWIDTHIHVSDAGQGGIRREGLFESLIDVLDRSDADLRFIVSPDVSWIDVAKREEDGVLRAGEFIHDLVQRAPGRLYGSCLVNPHFLDASLKAMELCFERRGFVQLGELVQYMLDYRLDTDATEALVRRAAGYGVPVQVHLSTSNSRQGLFGSGLEELDDFLGLIERVPDANYILAHAVGTPKNDPPVVDAYLDVIEGRYGRWPERFWMEIRDFDSPGVRSALARVPCNRIVAGTDWTTRIGPPFLPYGTIFGVKSAEENPYPPCVASMIGFLKEAGATEEAIAAIGSGNASALLGIPET